MSRLIKSYRTSSLSQHLLRIHPIEIPVAISNEEDSSETISPEDLVESARQEAGRILEAAEAERARMMDEFTRYQAEQNAALTEKADEALAVAREEGWNAGYLEGKEAAAAECAGYLQSAKEVLEEAILERNNYLAASEGIMQSIAIAIAEKMIRSELALKPEAVTELVKSCLYEIQEKGLVEIRVNPEDYRVVSGSKPELTTILPSQTEILVIPDSTITQGGCIIHTDQGIIDARIETGLQEMRSALKEICRGVAQ